MDVGVKCVSACTCVCTDGPVCCCFRLCPDTFTKWALIFFSFFSSKKNFFFKFILMLFFPLTLNSPKRAPAHAHSDTDIHAPNALYLQAIEWISPVQSATAADLSSNVCVCMCVCAGAGGNNFRGRWKKGNPCLKSDSCWKKKKEKKKVILIKEK